MNWNNYALIFIIITIVLTTCIEGRGGRGGGGGRSSGSHSSGSHSSGYHSSSSHGSGSHGSGSHGSGSKSSGSGGGGFWASLFGGSSSSSKTSSSHSSPSSSSSSSLSSSSDWKPSQQPSYNPYYQHTDNSFGSSPSKSSGSSQPSSSLSNWKPYQHTSYNSYPYYQHTANYDKNFGSNPSKASDSTDYLSGYMAGNLLSNHHKVYDSYDNEYLHPRVSGMANYEPESTTTAPITTAIQPDMGEWLNILTDFKYNPNDLNALEAHMTRIANIDLSKVLAPPSIAATVEATPSTTETIVSTPSTTSEVPTSSTELPSFTTESTTLTSELTSIILPKLPTAENKGHVVDSHTLVAIDPSDDLLSSSTTSSAEIVPVTTESTQEANLDISTPYGLICSPIIYNEINEFGVNLIIERLACYPALEPVTPLE